MTWRWGILGPGGIATRFADDLALVDDAIITAVASRSQERADAFADRFGIGARHTSVEALVADPDVDVVYVATPHSRHADDTITALNAGKHVLCEKPLALSARQARAMVDVARERGLFLMEALWSRFLPAYARLRELLEAGTLGEPLVVEADFGFHAPIDPVHRLFDRALGGGALLDLGIYPVQLCSLVFGPPDRVVADGNVGATGVDETVAAVLRHEGGGIGVVKASLQANLSCTARITCRDGWIRLPAFMHCPHRLDVNGPDGHERIDAHFTGDGLRFQVFEVHRCLDDGVIENPTMPHDESIRLAETLDAIREQLGVSYPGE